jgi:pimeloyl-ACP methyl ester carboxylesterase
MNADHPVRIPGLDTAGDLSPLAEPPADRPGSLTKRMDFAVPQLSKEEQRKIGALQRQIAQYRNELGKARSDRDANAVRLRTANDNVDVTGLLEQVTVPTLVMHCKGDGIVPFAEGRRMAAMIPGARFVPLEGDNHLILEDEPAWPIFLEEFRNFLAANN